MRASRLLLSVAALTSVGLAGCGSVVNGGTQKVNVVVRGSPTAACTFENSNFRNQGQYPNTVTLERSQYDLQADCQGEQNRHVAFVVPSRVTTQGTLGNAFNGFLPGGAYDAASGGLYAYPDPIIVDFREIGEGAKPQWPSDADVAATDAKVDTTRIGMAPIAAPQPVHMAPVMDEQLNPAQHASASQTTTTTTVVTPATLAVQNPAGGKSIMKPVASPEDQMGADPAAVKAKEKAKAAVAKKAKEEAAAKKREAAAAKKAAEEAAKAAAEQPVTPAPATPATGDTTSQTIVIPGNGAPATTTTTTTTAPVATPPTAATTTTPPATTTTTTTTTTAPAASGPTPLTAPADPAKNDMDKYLQGQ